MSLHKELEDIIDYYSDGYYSNQYDSESIMHNVVANNHIHLLRSLLNEDKNLINMKYDIRHKIKNNTGRSLLKIACQSDNINYEIILCLLENGAEIYKMILHDVICNYLLKGSPLLYSYDTTYSCALILEYM